MEKNKPANQIRLGKVKASIWKNETEKGIRYNVIVTKLYKQGENWETTANFSRDDLPLLAKIADLAHSWIYEQKAE